MEWYWYSWFVKYIFGVFWLLISLVSGEDTPVHISTLPPPTSWDLQFVAANVRTSHRLRIMISNSKYLLTTTYHCSKISKVGGQQFAELDRIIKNPPISGFRGNAAGYFCWYIRVLVILYHHKWTPGWCFQTCCIFPLIYGMSSFPLTNMFQDG